MLTKDGRIDILFFACYGLVAQLVERRICTAEVRSSTLLESTNFEKTKKEP